jgi:hypothetical protein
VTDKKTQPDARPPTFESYRPVTMLRPELCGCGHLRSLHVKDETCLADECPCREYEPK